MSAVTHPVISEIQIGGTTSTDEFIELYNPTDSSVDLTNWRLAKRTAAGQLDDELDIIAATMSGTITSHGYFLIAHEDYDGTVVEDMTYSGPETLATDNTFLLYDNANGLVDKVGLHDAHDYETAAYPSNPANNKSIERKAQAASTDESMSSGGADVSSGNGYDSDNNSLDFVYRKTEQGVDPQNSDSPVEPISTSPFPSVTPTPTPSQTPTPTPTPTPTASPISNPSSSPSSTPLASPTPTIMPSFTPSPTPQPSPSIQPLFRGFLFRCYIQYRIFTNSWFSFAIPHITCRFR